ncbi:DUF308 domain-containing protein [Microbacterium sp. LRZ72]|uniref:lipase family protein n=1 Tax=Microbacterium sp. LRZ72 TaxID=2942481 RepID=UPI0029B70478|nr:lipase family protein [Microbacterium sp. LRZ72]MDX2377386.1 DUF308 domain-containing protein [Microbacterium sp. LRZ72]
MNAPPPSRPPRTTALPRRGAVRRLIERAPAGVGIGVGAALMLLGIFIVTRPLTSLWVLALYVGLSAIASGAIELAAPRGAPRWFTRVAAWVWIVGGLVVLVFVGGNLDLLPDIIAALLVVGGLASFGGIVRGRLSERVLAAASGVAQIVFGTLALVWPDVTLLVVAVFFGVRTIIFGATIVLRSSRRVRGRPERLGEGATRRRRAGADAARFALAVLLLVAAGGSWAASSWLQDGAPVIDAFYDAPDVAPQAPGTLLRDDAYTGRIPEGAQVRRILYSTTDSFGRRATASGLVIYPEDRPLAALPVVLWNHGTTGVARGCAPSLTDSYATRWAIPDVNEAIARGWAVVASDYTGQGAEGVFPYLIGEGEARSSLDALRAADQIDDLWLGDDVVVWGHSQGGHAALWTTQIAAEYAPEYDILGTAAISPAADPLALAEELSGPRGSAMLSVLISWVLVPYADTYPDVVIDDYVAPGGRSIVREMTQRCPTEPGVVVSVLAALGVSADRPLYDANLGTGPLGERLAQNAARGPWDSPVMIAWGSDDEVIPERLYEQYIAEQCAAGATLEWYDYHGVDHTGVMLPGSPFLPTLIAWTQERFDGEPTRGDDCARLDP